MTLPARVRHALAVLAVGVLATLSLVAAPAAHADGTATTTQLIISANGPVGVFDKVTFDAYVNPSFATGRVQFVANTTIIGTADVLAGKATITTAYHELGTLTVTAHFMADPGAPYLESVSDPQTLVVKPVPAVWLTSVSGGTYPPGGQIRVRTTVKVNIAHFTPGHSASLTLTNRSLGIAVPIDSEGSGVATITLPTEPSVVTSLVAADGVVSAEFGFYIYNPPGSPSPTPSPTQQPATTPTPTPTSVPVGAGIPATGATPSLAHTGWDDPFVAVYGLLLVALGGLVYVRARPLGPGRHLRG